MNIFLSYASEQAAIAESVEVALSGEGHDVFRDRSDLASGEAYHARIRAAIAESDLLVFLISPQSVASGRYTLTELELAKEKWPNPSGYVLPVIVEPTGPQSIPAYLKGVTWLTPSGNVAASVAASVARLARPRRRPRIGAWAAVLVLALLVAAGLTARWAVERSRRASELSSLLNAGKAHQDARAYAAAWDAYAAAAAHSPRDDRVALAQERLAMDWLENIRVTVGVSTFTSIVEKVTPVLARCAGAGQSARAADCHAHLGWADFLRARDGAGGLDPAGHYRRALAIDPDNVYAHAMWGFDLLRSRASIADARARFDKALASGRERSYVRHLQIAGLLWGSNPETENEAVRVVNDMRRHGERGAGSASPVTETEAGRLWSVYMARVFNGYDRESFLAAVSAADHVATFLWLFPEPQTPPDKRNLRLFMLAVLQEHAGARADAVASYQAVRDALAKEGTLGAGGRLPDGTLAALKRLSRGRL